MIQTWMLTKCRAEQQMKIKTCLFYPYPRSYFSEWCHVPINIHQQDHGEKGSMCCIVKCIRCRNQARIKNADLRHPSCTVVMQWRKSASPVLNVLRLLYLVLDGWSGHIKMHYIHPPLHSASLKTVSLLCSLKSTWFYLTQRHYAAQLVSRGLCLSLLPLSHGQPV